MSGHIHSTAGARSTLVIAAALAVLLLKSRGQQLYIDQAPMNTTVFLGRYATFRCSSVSINPGSSTILWFMNETLIHQLPHEYDASSVSSQRTDAINGENSTLTVLGSEQSNGTHYRCGVLDLVTTTIVNYSALVTLTVQGIPHPPTGLQLNTSSGGELGTYVFKLTWTPLRTLLDKSDSNRQELIYVVHVYIGLNSSSRLLYRIETTLSSINITLKDLNTYNVTACNLSTVNFYVSAKFEEIGEGNVSSPVGFDSRDAEDICKTELMMMMERPGGLKRNKNNSQVIAASVGTTVGILLLSTAIIIISLIIILYKKRQELKMEINTNDAYGAINTGSTEKANESEIHTPTVDGQHVYEHIDNTVTVTIKETAVETHTNQAYESVITRKE